MEKIAILDKETIDKIAAGEVVERPASIVKELIENAIDAGATAVTVEIREGGISFIRITDNGSGIAKDQVRLAFLRHATSKIRSADDLVSVGSLGFRGEALSSIAAVSQVEIITKIPNDLLGVRYVIEGGEEKSYEEIGAPNGTTFLIKNLFYNTPARAKFLKTAMTEAGAVASCVEQMALSNPEISFKYMQNGQTKLHTSGNKNPKELVYHIYGREISKELVEINSSSDLMEIHGYLAKPAVSRGNRNFENYYVNGRYVKSKLLAKAIEDGYHGVMMQHKYPFTLLYITIDGTRVDVNVHPAKMELRFSNQEEIYRQLTEAIRETLRKPERILQVTFGQEESQKKPAVPLSKNTVPEPFENRRRAMETQKSMEIQKTSDPEDKNLFTAGSLPIYPEGYRRVSAVPSVPRRSVVKAPDPETGQKIRKQELSDTEQRAALKSAAKSTPVTGNPAEQENLPFTEKAEIKSDAARAQGQPKEQLYAQTPERETTVQETGDYITGEKTKINKKPEASSQNKAEQLELFDNRLLSKEARISHRILGQVFDTYWLVQYGDNLYIIDQHAAHEKVLYERMMAEFREKKIISQYVSPPLIVTLQSQEADLLKRHQKVFESFGFEIEPFGGKEYQISAVPDNLYGIASSELFLEILDHLEDCGGKTADLISEKLASMSCKAAVKGNHKLSTAEVEALIDELLTLENPYNCPHGRPTIISMSRYELEKKFKRIV